MLEDVYGNLKMYMSYGSGGEHFYLDGRNYVYTMGEDNVLEE